MEKPFRYLFYFDKLVAETIYCLLSLCFWKIWVTNYSYRGIVTLKHLSALIKQAKQVVYVNILCFYLEKKKINEKLIGMIWLI